MVIHDAKKPLVFLLKTDKIIVMEFILMTSNIRFENPNMGKRLAPIVDLYGQISLEKNNVDILCT